MQLRNGRYYVFIDDFGNMHLLHESEPEISILIHIADWSFTVKLRQ